MIYVNTMFFIVMLGVATFGPMAAFIAGRWSRDE